MPLALLCSALQLACKPIASVGRRELAKDKTQLTLSTLVVDGNNNVCNWNDDDDDGDDNNDNDDSTNNRLSFSRFVLDVVVAVEGVAYATVVDSDDIRNMKDKHNECGHNLATWQVYVCTSASACARARAKRINLGNCSNLNLETRVGVPTPILDSLYCVSFQATDRQQVAPVGRWLSFAADC